MRTRLFAAAPAVVLLAALAGAAKADTLWPLPQTLPDIYSGSTTVSYTADTNSFEAHGYAFELDTAAGTTAVTTGAETFGFFTLTASIDHAGHLIADTAKLKITGDIGAGDQTLILSDAPLQFGSGPGTTFQFLFSDNSGVIGNGATIGVKLYAYNGVNDDPSFATSFVNDGNGDSYAFVLPPAAPVPTPAAASAGLALLGLFGLKRAAARRQRH